MIIADICIADDNKNYALLIKHCRKWQVCNHSAVCVFFLEKGSKMLRLFFPKSMFKKCSLQM